MKRLINVAVLYALLFAAVASANAAESKPVCCSKEAPAAGPLPDQSLYQVESTWTDDASHEVKLASLAGRPQVVTMFFASCAYACPILVHDLKKIEAALPESLREKVGFTLVSFDTDRDTVEVLCRFRKQHKLPANWTLLRSQPDEVLELAALLGVKFKKDAQGQFAHSNLITVLDAEGEVAFQQNGLNTDPSAAVNAIANLLKAAAPKKPGDHQH